MKHALAACLKQEFPLFYPKRHVTSGPTHFDNREGRGMFMQNTPMPQGMTQDVPSRVRAAMDFLHYCRCVSGPQQVGMDQIQPGRDLDSAEKAAYSSALLMLNQYFSCEMDFGDAPPRQIRNDDDEPKDKVPAIA